MKILILLLKFKTTILMLLRWRCDI